MYARIGKMRVPDQPSKVKLVAGCFCHGEQREVVVDGVALMMYEAGAFMQDAFPELSDEDKEFLISGMCPKGWAAMCSEEGEDEDGED